MSSARRPDKNDEGYLVEFIRVGNAVKVSAVDPHTNTEVSIVGSPMMSQDHLTRNAIRKLEYVLNKKGGQGA